VKTPAWARSAIFDGIALFAPRGTGAAASAPRRTSLPAQPVVLQKLAAQSESADGKRAKELLERLRWPDGKTPVAAAPPLTEAQLALVEHGRQAYALCASCHQFDGKGLVNVAPPLAGSAWVNAAPDAVVRIILNGKKTGALQMPPLHTLDDTTIAAILTHVRRTWGNDAPPISPNEVKAIRSAVGSRTDAWTDAELAPFAKAR
jgi:mono/diheme cytochrome c family protein